MAYHPPRCEADYRIRVVRRLNKITKIVDECWLFTGYKEYGYGRTTWKGKKTLVHRISAHLYLDFDLNSDMLVLHRDDLCKHKNCWNPKHLYIGNHSQNASDRESQIKKTNAKQAQLAQRNS